MVLFYGFILVFAGIMGQAHAMQTPLTPAQMLDQHNDKIDELLRQADEQGDALALDCYMVTGDLERGQIEAVSPKQPEYERLLQEGLITAEGKLPKIVGDLFWMGRDREALPLLARKIAALKKVKAKIKYIDCLYHQAHDTDDFNAALCFGSIKNLEIGAIERVKQSDKTYARLHAGGIITAEGKLTNSTKKALKFMNKSKLK